MTRQWIEIPAGTVGTIVETGTTFEFDEIEVTEVNEEQGIETLILGGTVTVLTAAVHKINPAAWTWAR